MLCVRRRFDAIALRFGVGSSLGITKRHRVVAAQLDGDCVFVPALLPPESDTGRTYLVAIIEGTFHLRRPDERIDGGSFLLCKSRAWLNDHEGMVTLGGYRGIAMQIDHALLRGPSKMVVGALGRKAARAARALHEAMSEGAPPSAIVRAQGTYVDAMRSLGVPMPDRSALEQSVPREDARLSEALGASLSMHAGNPAIVDVASVLARAERTTRRRLAEVAAEYGLAHPRWQTLRQRWRLALAALMLTVPEATPELVRREMAFASTASLCHALRRAGLPSPRAIQSQAAAIRDGSPRG